MFRSFARLSLVVVIALALGLAAVSPAAAGELRRPAATVTNHWLAGAWVWVQAALGASPIGQLRFPDGSVRESLPGGRGVDQGRSLLKNTGSCIDPLGRPVPCGQW